MTHEDFVKLNPCICNTFDPLEPISKETLLVQGTFLANRTFILDTLKPEEASVISLRCGIFNQKPMQYKQISMELDINIMMVKEYESRALRKLRNVNRIKLLKNYTDDTIDKVVLEELLESTVLQRG